MSSHALRVLGAAWMERAWAVQGSLPYWIAC